MHDNGNYEHPHIVTIIRVNMKIMINGWPGWSSCAKSGIIFKTYFGSSGWSGRSCWSLLWLDKTRLLNHWPLDHAMMSWYSANGKTRDKSVFQSFVCHMTCNSRLELSLCIQYIQTSHIQYSTNEWNSIFLSFSFLRQHLFL